MLDASVGGIGGCPFAPRATGNIATEDLVYLLHGEGVETGIDLDGLIDGREWLEAQLGRQLEGQVYKAGTFAPVGRARDGRTGMAYRLGVDVGGTFTDLFLVDRRERRRASSG